LWRSRRCGYRVGRGSPSGSGTVAFLVVLTGALAVSPQALSEMLKRP